MRAMAVWALCATMAGGAAGCTGPQGGPVDLTPWRESSPRADLTADPKQAPRIAAPQERALVEQALGAAWEGRDPPRLRKEVKVAATIGGREGGGGEAGAQSFIACGEAEAQGLPWGSSGPKPFLVGFSAEGGELRARKTEIGRSPFELWRVLQACGEAGLLAR